MPYIPNVDQEEQPLQGAVAPGAPGTRTSAPSGVGAAGAGGSPTPQNAGGQFATLQSYLNANQGQAAPLAGKITSGIQNQYNALQGQNESTLSGIGGQVSSNALPNTNDVLAQEAANPVSFAGDQGNVKQFQGLLNASYGGPTSAEGTPEYQKQQAAVNNAIATGTAQTGTEAGREQLLSQNERRPTTGVTALNSAILTQSPDYLSQVQGAYKPFANLVSGLSSGAQDINKNIAKTQGDVSATNAAANKQIADQVNSLNTGLSNTANQDIAAQNKYNQAVQAFQSQWNPTNTAINSVNESMKKYFPASSPVNNPLTALLGTAPSNQIYTPESVATTDQAAQANAFRSLLAGINNGAPLPLITAAGTATAPGTAPTLDNNQIAQQLAREEQRVLPNNFLKSYQDTLNWEQVNPQWVAYNNLLKQLDPNVWSQV